MLIDKRAGVVLHQTFEKEGRSLKRRAGGYAHAKQYRRLRRVLKHQRTILGRVIRDLECWLGLLSEGIRKMATLWLERARRIHAQRPKDKNKLYALHAPEVECISKGKAPVNPLLQADCEGPTLISYAACCGTLMSETQS